MGRVIDFCNHSIRSGDLPFRVIARSEIPRPAGKQSVFKAEIAALCSQ